MKAEKRVEMIELANRVLALKINRYQKQYVHIKDDYFRNNQNFC